MVAAACGAGVGGRSGDQRGGRRPRAVTCASGDRPSRTRVCGVGEGRGDKRMGGAAEAGGAGSQVQASYGMRAGEDSMVEMSSPETGGW